ncbi:Igfbp2 [Columba livia]|nr:Igfbp2 [Columba livia]
MLMEVPGGLKPDSQKLQHWKLVATLEHVAPRLDVSTFVVATQPTCSLKCGSSHLMLGLLLCVQLIHEDNGDDRSESILAENHVDGTPGILSGAGGRKPIKTGMKELAVMREKVNEQQRQMGKVSKAHHNHEDSKKSRLSTGRTPCQQELDQVLERISTMRLPDERGPLEHLYSLHIPNCDKHGLYNLKQCKMSVNGQRGECWCVDPIHGKVIQGAPTIRGDPECHLFYTAHEQEDRGAHALRSQ